MAVILTLQDIINQTADFNQNYTASVIDQGNVIRAINRAMEFVQRRLGLPSDRKIQSFYFYEDTHYYALNSDFSDFVQLYYNTTNVNTDGDHNTPANRWYSYEDTELLRSTANNLIKNRFGFTTNNGSNQLVLDGNNLNPSTIVQSCDSTSGFTFSSSVTGAAVDANIYRQGSASIAFNVTTGESTSVITFPAVNMDIRRQLNYVGAFRLYVFFPTGVDTTYFTNLGLRLQSSANNYYDITTTADYLGTAWASNGWSLLSFPLSSATTTGSPDASAITTIQLRMPHGASFVAISNMRIDQLYLIQPDYLDLSYYSAYKGTSSDGTTSKIILDTVSDIVSFGSFAPDLILPVSLKAALILWPQLRADKDFMGTFKQDFEETMKLYGKQYPRKRNPNAAGTQLLR